MRAAPEHPNNLDPLRGLAAAAVLCHHCSVYTGYALPWLSQLGGLLGVQLFFVISGYLIVQSASAHHWSVYLTRRAFRIYPAYWSAVLLVGAATTPLTAWHWPEEWSVYAIHFFAFTHFSPSALLRHDVLTVSWTLTVEWCWYLLAPLLVWGAQRTGLRHYWLVAGLAALIVSSAWVRLAQGGSLDPLYASAIAHSGVSPVNEFTRFAYIVNSAPAQLVFFMVGALIWRYELALRRLPWWAAGMVLGVAVGGVLEWNDLLGLHPSFVSGLGLGALLLLALQAPLIAWRWPHQLGQWAYPIYLLHVPILVAVFHRFKFEGLPALSMALAAIVVASALLHYLVEAPANRWGRALVGQ